MDTFIAIAILLLILAGLAALLERTHRRTAGLPRAPFGADLQCDADIVRVLHEIDARRGRGAGR